MGKVTGFLEIPREQPTRRKAEERINDWFEIYEPFPEEKQREQGARCMDCGVPFCHTGCPVNNLIPDWNDLVYRDRWEAGHSPPALDQQLPGVHRPRLPGALRGRLRARHQPAARLHQAHRALDRRARLGRGLDSSRAARAGHRQARGRRRLRARRPGRRPAASPAPATPSPSSRRADRIGGLLRYGIPELQAGKARPRPPHRADERRRRRLPDQRARRRQRSGRDRSPKASTPFCSAAAPSSPATSQIPGRELKGIHFAMEFLPQQNHRNEGDTDRSVQHRRSSPPASASSSSAAATPAPTASAPPSPGRRSASTSSRSCPSRPAERARLHALAALAPATAHRKLARRGRHRDWGINSVQFTGDEHGQCQAGSRRSRRPAAEVRADRRHRVHPRCRSRPARHGLPRPGPQRHDRAARPRARRARQRRHHRIT